MRSELYVSMEIAFTWYHHLTKFWLDTSQLMRSCCSTSIQTDRFWLKTELSLSMDMGNTERNSQTTLRTLKSYRDQWVDHKTLFLTLVVCHGIHHSPHHCNFCSHILHHPEDGFIPISMTLLRWKFEFWLDLISLEVAHQWKQVQVIEVGTWSLFCS